MKLLTVLGTRPEIIRLSALIPRLDAGCEHTLVHTGQNTGPSLSDVFFAELGLRAPDEHLGVDGVTFGARVGQIIERAEAVMRTVRPDRLLVLGDTDSSLCVLAARRLGIEVFHMEAGNRCYDPRSPEEVNRRVIDHASDVLLPYTERSRANLLREGIPPERVVVTGNPIFEVMEAHRAAIDASDVLPRLGLTPGGYLLATAHRQESVDYEGRLRSLVAALLLVGESLGLPVVCSAHPRLRDRLEAFGMAVDGRIRLYEPFGFCDFARLEQGARCVLTDSGTVQEECCILGVPAVVVRDATERPETVECGASIVAGVEPDRVLAAARKLLSHDASWRPPAEYLAPAVSETVAALLLR